MESDEDISLSETTDDDTGDDDFDTALKVFRDDGTPEKTKFIESSDNEEDKSPIEEVNLTVPNTDGPHLPILTVRTWVIGVVICVFLAFVNQFFYFRSSPIVISALAGQVVSLYLGRRMASGCPTRNLVCGAQPRPLQCEGACAHQCLCWVWQCFWKRRSRGNAAHYSS